MTRICEQCGNDAASARLRLCSDCLDRLDARHILIGCMPIDVPQGGYISPDTPRCINCDTPLSPGGRTRALKAARPDVYQFACIECLPTLLGIADL